MTPTEPAEAGDIRFTEVGDVEVFDGESWTAIDPLTSDPNVGDRTDAEPALSPDQRPAGSLAPESPP